MPRKFFIGGLLLGGLPLAFLPALSLVSYTSEAIDAQGEATAALLSAAAGGITGTILGVCLAGTRGARGGIATGNAALVCGLAFVGLFLGWQAELSVACMTAAGLLFLAGVRLITGNEVARPASLLVIATIMQIFFWNELRRVSWWPGPM